MTVSEEAARSIWQWICTNIQNSSLFIQTKIRAVFTFFFLSAWVAIQNASCTWCICVCYEEKILIHYSNGILLILFLLFIVVEVFYSIRIGFFQEHCFSFFIHHLSYVKIETMCDIKKRRTSGTILKKDILQVNFEYDNLSFK